MEYEEDLFFKGQDTEIDRHNRSPRKNITSADKE